MDQFSICVTVGTLDRPFDRLIGYVNNYSVNVLTGFVQYGAASVDALEPGSLASLTKVNFSTDADLGLAMRTAKVVISHAGVGSILKANELGKPLIIVPRLKKYAEHFDDHQTQIANYVKGRRGIFVVADEDQSAFNECMMLASSFEGEVDALLNPRPFQDFIRQRVEAD